MLDWKSGLDVLDGERKLGWRAMEIGVLIPVRRSVWLARLVTFLLVVCLLCLVRFSVLWWEPLFCVIAWASVLWRCQSLVDPLCLRYWCWRCSLFFERILGVELAVVTRFA